jgi:small subunit ribosomal protein S2
MQPIDTKAMLEAGVHFGHLKKKWNPKMRPYIFMEKKGIHIIDLNKTKTKLEEAAAAVRSIARSGRKIMFVATKKQAKDIVANAARSVNMPYVTERWLGGMMTNFSTIRRSVKKMQSIEKMLGDASAETNITKKERLVLGREKEKMEKVLGGIAQLNRLPAALFIVDVSHEEIAVAEAKRLNITTLGIVDTNSDPSEVDFPIPANDDATKSIQIIMDYITQAIVEGLEDRKNDKDTLDNEPETDAETTSTEEAAEGTAPRRRKKTVVRTKTVATVAEPDANTETEVTEEEE